MQKIQILKFLRVPSIWNLGVCLLCIREYVPLMVPFEMRCGDRHRGYKNHIVSGKLSQHNEIKCASHIQDETSQVKLSVNPPTICLDACYKHFMQKMQIVKRKNDKAVLEPRVSPAFAITYFCNHCNIRIENTSNYVDTLTLFFQKLEPKVIDP